jgi:hypothetical protein
MADQQDVSRPNYLVGTTVAWAKLVLIKVGFDATAEDANSWLPPMFSESGADDITEQDLELARRELARAGACPTKQDILSSQVEILVLSPAGQQAVREAIQSRRVPRHAVAQILDE